MGYRILWVLKTNRCRITGSAITDLYIAITYFKIDLAGCGETVQVPEAFSKGKEAAVSDIDYKTLEPFIFCENCFKITPVLSVMTNLNFNRYFAFVVY